MPFTVPHDAREPLQLSCTDGAALGVLTDLGHATPHVMAQLQAATPCCWSPTTTPNCWPSVYPPFLKRRVGGDYGHLSNAAAAGIACAANHSGLKHVVAAHLSAQNNRPDLAQDALSHALGCHRSDILVAGAASGTPWLQI